MGAPDEFHPDAHPKAREITGDRQYGEWGQCIVDPASSTGERCRGYAKGPHGKCHNHGGSTPSGDENPKQGRGDQEGNDNAVTHGAFQEHFTSNLTEGEQAAFTDAYNQLEDAHGAQDIARSAASICLLQFRRSGDERFLRRFEGICDKFEIAPAERLEVDVDEERSIDEEDKGEIVNAIESLRDGDD
ncbi:hypothetical protein [Natrinema pallidum]|uniref:hypothetical protein n=1 Tax=Natrinema pallidum TaxID=69527 RepID=UPI00375073D6